MKILGEIGSLPSKKSLRSFGSNPSVPLTGPRSGIASGTTATIVVMSGQVSSCMITAGANGINYQPGQTVSAPAPSIGGTKATRKALQMKSPREFTAVINPGPVRSTGATPLATLAPLSLDVEQML
jgi:hypothetical protein